jgi:hypothetical protein
MVKLPQPIGGGIGPGFGNGFGASPGYFIAGALVPGSTDTLISTWAVGLGYE